MLLGRACPGRALLSGGLLLLVLAKHLSLEIREADHHDRHVIERPSHQRILDNIFHSEPALLMHVGCPPVAHTIPDALHGLLIREFVKYPIAWISYPSTTYWPAQ